MNISNTNILVLGGGYAGVMAALRLAGKTKRMPTTITLVNALDHFVERPRLHEQATGTQLQGKQMSAMLRGTKARFILGWFTEIESNSQTVKIRTEDGIVEEPYDILVYALGSATNRAGIPGVDEFAYTLDPYGHRTTFDLKNRLLDLATDPIHAAIIGGGATGVEMAAQLKGNFPNTEVSLWTKDKAGAFKGPFNNISPPTGPVSRLSQPLPSTLCMKARSRA